MKHVLFLKKIFLKENINALKEKVKELERLEKKLKNSNDNVDELIAELITIRVKILWLIEQSRIGLERVVWAQKTQNLQTAEMERFTLVFIELEDWLEKGRTLIRQEVNPGNEEEIKYLIQAFEVS